jgi:hypothetical protein
LSDSATAFSELLRLLGWEVYTTFYLPPWMIVVTVIVAVVLAGIGLTARRRRA